jgi:hypothetical protein
LSCTRRHSCNYLRVCTRHNLLLSIILNAHIMVTYIHGVALSLLSPQPFCPRCYPFSLPFVLPFTYLAPSSCDRNRPPSYQVACRLTLSAPPFTQSAHPFQIPRTPIAQRLTTTTLGPLRFHYAEHYCIVYNWSNTKDFNCLE